MHESFIYQTYLKDVAVCDTVIDYHTKSNNKTPGMIFGDEGPTVDKVVKDSTDVVVQNGALSEYFHQLKLASMEYVDKYPQCAMYGRWGIIQAPTIQKYDPNGGFVKWHTERNNDPNPLVAMRHLVFMTYLNDVTDGGETEFDLQKLKVQPRKGLTLIWPADWTHTHRGVVSPTQEKYIITGWFCYV